MDPKIVELENRFIYHTPTELKKEKHEEIREEFLSLAENLYVLCPEGRERSLAWTKLDQNRKSKEKKINISEKSIQGRLMFHVLGQLHHLFAVPNCTTLFPWEADVLSATKSGLLVEWEIKISRSDFFADFKKRKHVLYQDKFFIERYCAAYFNYVVSENTGIGVDDIPKYAGLWVLKDGKYPYFSVIKRAPMLSKRKVSDKDNKKLLSTMSWRMSTLLKKVHPLKD